MPRSQPNQRSRRAEPRQQSLPDLEDPDLARVTFERLPHGTLFHKPKGKVPFLKLEPVSFRDVMNNLRGVRLYPHMDGILRPERSEYREINARTLSFLRSSWGSQRRHFSHVAVSLSTGNIESFSATKVVVPLVGSPNQIQAEASERFLLRSVQVLGDKVGSQFVMISYCALTWSKGGAWRHLVEHPPAQLDRKPGISDTDNPYRKRHRGDEWIWSARIPPPRKTLWEIILE